MSGLRVDRVGSYSRRRDAGLDLGELPLAIGDHLHHGRRLGVGREERLSGVDFKWALAERLLPSQRDKRNRGSPEPPASDK